MNDLARTPKQVGNLIRRTRKKRGWRHGDAHIDGSSGWGAIEMRGIEYVPVSLLPQ